MRRRTVYLAFTLLGLVLTPGLRADEGAIATARTFKILVREPGIYRVEHEDLVEAGLDPAWEGDELRLTQRGIESALWRSDRQGRFGPGDSLLFRGEALRGEHSFLDDHTDINVLVLELGGGAGPDMRVVAAPSILKDPPVPSALERRVHHESDDLLLRFAEREDEPSRDGWFWAKLTQIDKRPFELPLDLTDFDPESGALSLTVVLRGWSLRRSNRGDDIRDHVVEVALNDQLIATTSFQAQEEHRLDIEDVDPDIVEPDRNVLTVSIPKRLQDDGETVIDVVLLNWIEVRHGRGPQLHAEQQQLIALGSENRLARLTTREPRTVDVFGADGTRRLVATTPAGQGQNHFVAVGASDGETLEITAVLDGAFRQPLAVVADEPSDLRSRANRADYLMIGHSSLLGAIQPLAAFHRQRGLVVELIDVVDIYDEFNHGILHPRAIRDFLSLAYHDWARPAPRFVLLVGDASWDTKNKDPKDRQYADWTYRPGEVSRFLKNQSTGYESGIRGALRNLIPTGSFSSAQGHAASDNFFVTVDGEDYLPDLAIGRLPVVSPDEVEAIVAKTIDYMTASPVGPWRRDLLWITNESSVFQRSSDLLADETLRRGFGGSRIYPQPEEPDNVHHQELLLGALNSGKLLVHFLGHGGRYIWRTGPPDFRKNHDLFTLEHLDQLAPSAMLPVVLSMTCYSAPFDHPNADSIGEKFLRVADRGAVAVLAASWRNSPSYQFSASTVERLLEARTVGEAIMEAKRRTGSRNLIETYNLLGDPALELARPAHRLRLFWDPGTGESARSVVVDLDSAGPTTEARGSLRLTWTDREGRLVASDDLDVEGFPMTIPVPTDEPGIDSAQAYYWDPETEVDAVGALEVLAPELEAE